MGLCDLAQTLASSSIEKDGSTIDIEWLPADMPAFQPGTTHPCPHPLDDEVPFELGDRTDDDDDGPPQRAAGIKVLPKAHELDVEVVEFVEHLEEVPDGSGDPVGSPDQQHLEASAARISKELIETRPASLGPGDPIGILGNDLKTPLVGHRAEIMELGLGVLVYSGYAQIQSNSFHIFPSSEATTSRK
jgi:hypothetical protein